MVNDRTLGPARPARTGMSWSSTFLGAIALAAVALLALPFTASAEDGSTCSNAEFRDGWSANLPDCRAYELVTSTEFMQGLSLNLSASPVPSLGNPMPGSDGNKVLWEIVTPVGDSVSSTGITAAASRGSGGWTSRALTPKACSPEVYGNLQPSYSVALGASTDLSKTVVQESASPNCDDPDDQAGDDLYLVDELRQKHWLSHNGEVKTANVNPVYTGASADLSHVVFSTREQLVPAVDSGRVSSATGLYERFAGQTRAVGVDDSGQAVNVCGAKATGGTPSGNSSRTKVSPNGRVIYFLAGTSGDPSCDVVNGGGQLYARIDGERTVQVSASELSPPTVAPAAAGFTNDGLTAFFASSDQLTADATPGGGLYRYDLRDVMNGTAASGSLTFLTPQATDPNGPTIHEVVGSTDDGTVGYFEATGDLAPGAPSQRALYRFDKDGVSLVADNQAATSASWFLASISNNGRWLAYRGEHPNGSRQIYLYDADGGAAPVCASCPQGGTPTEDAFAWAKGPNDGAQKIAELPTPWVTDDGRVYFTTPENLVPEDVNAANDAYEYGSGEAKLISSGMASRYGSVLTGTSRDGKDVFIATTDTLLASDHDNGDDSIYVARVGGGFPQPDPPEPLCEGEACQASTGAAPAAPLLGSVGFGADSPTWRPRSRAGMRVKRMNATRGAVARLKVRVPAAGRIVVAGRTVRRARRAAPRAGLYPVRVALGARPRQVLRKRGRLRVAARVLFKAPGERVSAKRVRVVFRAPAKQRGRNASARSTNPRRAGR